MEQWLSCRRQPKAFNSRMPMTASPASLHPQDRLLQIAQARRAVLVDGQVSGEVPMEGWSGRGWIERSWLRCLAGGRRPEQRVVFDVLGAQAPRRAQEANQALLQAARPTLDRLGRAVANSRYFAILTDAQGVVVDVAGPIDRSDRRAFLITRIGTDLSERAVGTTAIGAVLAEQQPLWLHRGEHFFNDTSVYSCVGAPLYGADGHCVGMLDLTGIEAQERPELRHLAAQSALSIGNAMVLAQPHQLLLRLGWPGRALGGDTDALICLDGDGQVVSANAAARELMAPLRESRGAPPLHCSELFAMPWEMLFDSGGREAAIDVPLWSGLTLQVLPMQPGAAPARPVAPRQAVPLRDLETTLIRRAVEEARGNVMQAARALGISRATVYRKLVGRKRDPGGGT